MQKATPLSPLGAGMNADILIVGGGLAGGLTALRLSQLHPDKKVLLLERESTLGGNQTWNFFERDLAPERSSENGGAPQNELWFHSLVSKTWDATEIRFPKMNRVIEGRYHSIRSEKFHKELMVKLGRAVRLGSEVKRIAGSEVELANGDILRAPLVIDASGIRTEQKTARTFAGAACGWTKFLAFDVKLKKPHGLPHPILTDANVPQMDGYRCFYVLPWDETRLFIKENFLSVEPDLNIPRLTRSIRAYAERAGWEIASIERTEEGSMPLPLYDLEFDLLQPKSDRPVEFSGEDFVDQTPVRISSGTGWFQSATGQALPDAVRIADFICELPQLRTGPVRAELREFRKGWIDQQKFYRLLNRMVFRAAEPSLRFQIFERFFSLHEELIERFFSGTTARADRQRILGAKPIVRPGRATKNWMADEPTVSPVAIVTAEA